MRLPKRNKISIVLLGTVLSLYGCGSSDDDDEATTDSSVNSPSEVVSENPLAAAYPSTLAVSVLPKTSAGLVQEDEESKDVKEKISDRKKILKGDSDCFSEKLFDDRRAEAVSCYEFDNDMNPYTYPSQGGMPLVQQNSGGTIDGKHADGEACLVAFARQEVLGATQYVDRALDTVAGMLCAIKKAGGDTTLPAEGEEKDFLSSLGESNIAKRFTTAKMSNLGDGIYKTSVVIDNGDNGKAAMTLAYKAGASEGESSGVISFAQSGRRSEGRPPQLVQQEGGEPRIDPNNTQNMVQYISVAYSQNLNADGELQNKSEVRIANIEKSLQGLGDDGLINYDVIPQNAMNDTANNFKYVSIDINVETAEGDIAYWRNPGGRYEESARGFIFNISNNEEGQLAGCADSGAAGSDSIRKSLGAGGSADALKPVRFWHPFNNNNTNVTEDDRYIGGNEGPYITGQCFQRTSAGLYEIDYEATKALSATTDDAEVERHGYDVIPQADGNERVKRPAPPAAPPSGDFKPESISS